MKGMIFTEFLEMVSEVFSPEMVETIIDASNLPTQGAYTDVGTYDYQELITLVSCLSIATKIPVSELEIAYGKYLFKKLLKRYVLFKQSSDLMATVHSTFDFLQLVDQQVHVEVLKLYPEAELPRFYCTTVDANTMTMEYRSLHPFSDLAEGLILGCADYFKEKIEVERQNLPAQEEKIHRVLFTLRHVR